MTKKPDDLEAVRIVTSALEAFEIEDRLRIIRWAAEKLGLTPPFATHQLGPAKFGVEPGPSASVVSSGSLDIKTFYEQRKPKSDIQFAALVAYWHKFEAPDRERKSFINTQDLLDACRKTQRRIPPDPIQTLRNAHNAGLLDRSVADGKGAYTINSVGENLVSLTLPGGTDNVKVARDKSRKGKTKRKARASRSSSK